MSDTPRTDECAWPIRDSYLGAHGILEVTESSLARDLERELAAAIKERDALKQRVAELESQPQPHQAHAERDLRERLVCAALSGACGLANAQWSTPKHLANEVVQVAEETLAAMRQQGGGA